MRRKIGILLLTIMLIALPFSGCGNSASEDDDDKVTEANQNEDDQNEDETEVIETTSAPLAGGENDLGTSGTAETLADYTDAWTELYGKHEASINAYTGMPILDLVMVGMPLANAIFYSLLNIENVDGDFEGVIGFSNVEGYYNKKGDVAEFGNDYIRGSDGFTPTEKEGDRVLTEGLFDAGKGYLKVDDQVYREDEMISRVHTEFQRFEDERFICLYQVIGMLDYSGTVAKTNRLTFIDMGTEHYEFVIAEGDQGIEGELLSLSDAMNVEDATALFDMYNYKIVNTGSIEDGVFKVNTP